MNIIVIIASIFILLGVIQLFINFNISLLLTIILTLVVGAMYIYTDKQCKNQNKCDDNITAPEDMPEPENIEETEEINETSECTEQDKE